METGMWPFFFWQLVLSNGCVISMVVSGHSGDVEKIFIDKSMIGKFSCETVCDGKLLWIVTSVKY